VATNQGSDGEQDHVLISLYPRTALLARSSPDWPGTSLPPTPHTAPASDLPRVFQITAHPIHPLGTPLLPTLTRPPLARDPPNDVMLTQPIAPFLRTIQPSLHHCTPLLFHCSYSSRLVMTHRCCASYSFLSHDQLPLFYIHTFVDLYCFLLYSGFGMSCHCHGHSRV